jgi:hypothetical protein
MRVTAFDFPPFRWPHSDFGEKKDFLGCFAYAAYGRMVRSRLVNVGGALCRYQLSRGKYIYIGHFLKIWITFGYFNFIACLVKSSQSFVLSIFRCRRWFLPLQFIAIPYSKTPWCRE